MRTVKRCLRSLAFLAIVVVILLFVRTKLDLKFLSFDNFLEKILDKDGSVVITTLTPEPLPEAADSPTPTLTLPSNAQYTTRQTDPRLKSWLKELPSTIELTEYLSVVVIPEQKNYIFRGKTLIKIYTISTGAGEQVMPEGLWQIGEKRDSNLGGIYGPRLMFLELWNGKNFEKTTRAFHGTNEPKKIGTNFGLGCVYHYNGDILELYELLPEGSLVVTTNDKEILDWEILIGGTVVLSRGVDERIRLYNNINYPWEKIAFLTWVADLTIVNFKSPFAKDCPYVPDKAVFCSQTDYVKGMNFARIDLVSIAGNHIGDYGVDNILYTTEVFIDNNILFSGAGKNGYEASKSQIIRLETNFDDSLTVGFFAYNTVPGTSPVAGDGSVGVAWWNEKEIKSLVGEIKSHVDILIAMPNWGAEYTHQPIQEQIEMGRKMVDWGVDIVAGDQAHWVQKYEEYKDGLIFYGLGNLVFDQMWSEKTRQGVLLKLIFDKDKKVSYELIPVIIEDYAQPRLATEQESQIILDPITPAGL